MEGYHSVPDLPHLASLSRALILEKGYRDKDIAAIAREAAIADGHVQMKFTVRLPPANIGAPGWRKGCPRASMVILRAPLRLAAAVVVVIAAMSPALAAEGVTCSTSFRAIASASVPAATGQSTPAAEACRRITRRPSRCSARQPNRVSLAPKNPDAIDAQRPPIVQSKIADPQAKRLARHQCEADSPATL